MLPVESDVLVLRLVNSLSEICFVTEQTMLNVTTFLKEMSPARCLSTNDLYMSKGLLPVGSPRMKGLDSVGANVLIRSRILDHAAGAGS